MKPLIKMIIETLISQMVAIIALVGIVTLMVMMTGCTNPEGKDSTTTTIPSREAKSVTMNILTCKEISTGLDKDYTIQADAEVFVIQMMALYKWNLTNNQIELVKDGAYTLSSVCNITVQNGIISSVTALQSTPGCGGIFQPSCPPTHQPYPCGPNGQMCY